MMWQPLKGRFHSVNHLSKQSFIYSIKMYRQNIAQVAAQQQLNDDDNKNNDINNKGLMGLAWPCSIPA